jgi:hypothetical protein
MSDLDPRAPWWCWTEDEPSTFRCRELGHDVRPVRKLGDPATREWRQALSQSTGAQLRAALDANQALAMEHAKCVIELERLRAELKTANDAALRLIQTITQLRGQITHRPGPYWPTAKARAALAQTDTPQEKP